MSLRLQKSFNFKERYHLDLFMEGYDILNTPSFLAPSGVISSPAFLIRATANNPRQLQWGARFTFKSEMRVEDQERAAGEYSALQGRSIQ